MKYVYPNNLMARRSENREIIKGGILFAAFVIVIAVLFFASEYGQTHNFMPTKVHCVPNGTELDCSLK